MRPTRVLGYPRRLYASLDYARNFPKSYLDELKRHLPRKVWSNRFGAPDLIRWRLKPPDPSKATENATRPWDQNTLHKALQQERNYHYFLLKDKMAFPTPNTPWDHEPFYKVKRIPDDEWTIFPGDLVQVMVGKDKGVQGNVSYVIRDANAVFVHGLHTKLKPVMEDSERLGLTKMLRWEEHPLFLHKGEVKLVDPNDSEPCEANWVLNDAKDTYIRISGRTGYQIPLPKEAYITFDYIMPEDYVEVKGKDTPAKLVLKKTYLPKLSTFEEEMMELYKIDEPRKHKPTYWY